VVGPKLLLAHLHNLHLQLFGCLPSASTAVCRRKVISCWPSWKVVGPELLLAHLHHLHLRSSAASRQPSSLYVYAKLSILVSVSPSSVPSFLTSLHHLCLNLFGRQFHMWKQRAQFSYSPSEVLSHRFLMNTCHPPLQLSICHPDPKRKRLDRSGPTKYVLSSLQPSINFTSNILDTIRASKAH
jgi:hypothetical protein